MKAHFTPPGFIVGVGRSGTTLLASILNRHPQLFVTPETAFFHHAINYPGGIDRLRKDWPSSLTWIAARMNDTPDFDIRTTTEEVLSRLGASRPTLSQLFSTFGGVLAQRANKELWIEKTPIHVQYLKEIRETFPQAPIIHLVRDGRSVAESRSRMPYLEGPGKDYFNNLLAWANSVQLAHAQLNRDPYALELRYEDLVTSPEETVRLICSFLGIEYYDSMLLPDGSETGLIELWANHKDGIRQPIDRTRISRWKESLSGSTQLISSILAGDELERLGYETDINNTNKNLVRVFITEDFFKDSIRGAIISILEKLTASNHALRLARFFSVADKSPRTLNIRTVPKLTIQLLNINDLMANRSDIVIIATPRIPKFSNIFFTIFYLLRLSNALRKTRIQGTKLVFVFDCNSNSTSTWRLRRLTEKLIVKQSDIIVCNCGTPKQCIMNDLFSLKNKEIYHLSSDKLAQGRATQDPRS